MLFIEGESNKLIPIPIHKKIEAGESKHLLNTPINNEKIDEISDLCSEMFSEDNDGSKLVTELQSRNSKDSSNQELSTFFPKNDDNTKDYFIEKQSNLNDEKSLNEDLHQENNDDNDDNNSEINCLENLKENKDDSMSDNSKYNVHNYDIFFVNSDKDNKQEFFANTFGKTDKNPEDWDNNSDSRVSNKSFKEENKNENKNSFNLSNKNINTMDICIKEKNFDSESEFDEESSKYSKSDSKKDFLDIQVNNIVDNKSSEKKITTPFNFSESQTSLENKKNISKPLSYRNYSQKTIFEDFKQQKKDFTKKNTIEQFGSDIKSLQGRSKSPIHGLKGSLDVDYLIGNKNSNQENTQLTTLQNMFNSLKKSISIQKLSSKKNKTPIKLGSNNYLDNFTDKKSISKSSKIKKNSLMKSLSKSFKKKKISPTSSNSKKVPFDALSKKYLN